ncbi:hypothetical protein BCT92_00280 [Vibrio sp. 10N.261.52.E5]|nr:hypothetical protein BCT92_00280 [Vibrio sp. 10N.261.52.E5]
MHFLIRRFSKIDWLNFVLIRYKNRANEKGVEINLFEKAMIPIEIHINVPLFREILVKLLF